MYSEITEIINAAFAETNVMIFKHIFAPKNVSKILALGFAKMIITLVFFAESWKKSPKIAVIASTPECTSSTQIVRKGECFSVLTLCKKKKLFSAEIKK
jgi:hypothetical protein